MNTHYSDTAIRAGIIIGDARMPQTIKAIYDKCKDVFLDNIISSEDENGIELNVLWEAVECFYHGVRTEQMDIPENVSLPHFIFEIAQNIKENKLESSFLGEKPIWDYYLSLLDACSPVEREILIKTFVENDSMEDLSKKMVAKGFFSDPKEVVLAKEKVMQKLLKHL